MFGQVRQTAFFRIFFSVIILLITVISCLTLGFTAVFETILEDFLVKTYISNLHIIKENYTRLQYTFIPAAFNVYENEAVQDYLFARRGDQEAALYALKFMDKAVILNPYIHSFYAYNAAYGYLSTFAGYEGAICTSDPQLNDFLLKKEVQPRQIYLRTLNNGGKPTTFYTLFLGRKNPDTGIHYAFMVNICESCIREELSAASKIDYADLCIINAENVIVSDKLPHKIGLNAGEDSMLNAVMQQMETTGAVTVSASNGEKYFAAWVDQNEIGWRFLYLIPQRVIFKIINGVRTKGLLIALAILTGALCLALILSMHIEKKVTAEKKLFDYCFGCAEYPFTSFFKNEDIHLAVCRFDPQEKEKELLQKAVLCIKQNQKSSTFFIQFDGNKWIVLVQENIGFFKTKLFDIQHKLQNECRGTFTAVFFEAKIPFSDVPSQSAILISKLQTLYMKTAGTIEAVDTPLPVLLQEKNQSTCDEFDFSNLERALREKKSDAMQCEIQKLSAFLTQTNNFLVFRTCVIQIVLIAAKIWDETLDILLPQGINAWRNEVFAVEQITGLITKLEQLNLCITRSLELEQNSHKTKIVRHIKNYIFDNIRNKNLNTALIADSLGFSLNYIREIFKTVEKRSINEYIGLYRIELAKQLLIETEKNIYCICDEVGFSNYSYFCTYFKKMECISPTDFRLNMHILK